MERKRTAKVLLSLVMVVMVTIASVFVSPSTYAEAASGTVKNVTVTNIPSNTLTLKRGSSKVVKTKVVAAKGRVSQKVTFKSSNTKLVTVNAKGRITANKKKNGTATVTITSAANKKKSFKIKVTVGTPVKQVKLNKKSATLYIGDSTTLKATVSPKRASNKKLVWTSSNDKIVKVNSKGKISAVAAGKAKITVTAKDGSGKKATCKVVVANPIVMDSVSVYNEATINVKLSAAQPLTVANFEVKTKAYEDGTYKKTCAIDSVVTTDNVNYVITLNQDTLVAKEAYVQVTANGLNATGTQSLETIYKRNVYNFTSDRTFSCKVGEPTSYEYNSSSDVVSIDAVPAGMTYEVKNGQLKIYGTPAAAGVSASTIRSENELGDIFTETIYWFIYDDVNIVGGTTPTYTVTGKDGTAEISKSYSVYGGSGYCDYTLLDGCGYFGFETRTDGSVKSYTTIKGKAPAGNYNVVVQVRDRGTGSVTNAVIPIVIAPAVNVTGTIFDGSGAAVTGYTDTYVGLPGYAEAHSLANVYFENQDESNRFSYSSPEVNPDGTYSAFVPAGVYDVTASVSGEHKTYYDVNATANTAANLQIPTVFKVAIATDNAVYTANTLGYWVDAQGQTVGAADVVYLPAGTTTIKTEANSHIDWSSNEDGTVTNEKHTNIFNGYADFSAAVTLTVAGDMSVVAPVTVASEPATLVADTPLSIPVGFKGYIKFIPVVDGTYYMRNLYSASYLTTYADPTTGLVSATYDEVSADESNAYSSNGAYYKPITLKAGVTYYFYENNTGADAAPHDIFITATAPARDTNEY